MGKLTQKEIAELLELLRKHREILSIYLQQLATKGRSFASPLELLLIDKERDDIRRIKIILRDNGVIVVDQPIDANEFDIYQTLLSPGSSLDFPPLLSQGTSLNFLFIIITLVITIPLMALMLVILMNQWTRSQSIPLKTEIISIKQRVYALGGCYRPAYDRDGNLYDKEGDIFVIAPSANNYTVTGPLYEATEEVYNQVGININDVLGCAARRQPPQKMPPDIAQKGIPYYPAILRIDTISEKMASGESTRLIATLSFTDAFTNTLSNNEFMYAINITNTETIPVSFRIDAPNFEYNPSTEELGTQDFGIGHDVSAAWVISPKANALGEQQIAIQVNGIDRMAVGAYIRILVTDSTGISPYYLAIGSLLLAGLASLATIITQLENIKKIVGLIPFKGKKEVQRNTTPVKKNQNKKSSNKR